MVTINKETVKQLAKLSRIAVQPDEEEALVQDLKKIVAYVEQLGEVDTANVLPCRYVAQSLDKAPLRNDEIQVTLNAEEFLKLTPQQTARMVRVPPVLKQE